MKQAQLILALDVDNLSQAEEVIRDVSGHVDFFKIGLQLYIREGKKAVELAKKHGKVFLDLKIHDIPNTVFHAVKQAARMGADLIDVHASGGEAMMKAAADGVKGSSSQLIAVTVLTSLCSDELKNELRLSGTAVEIVTHYAGMALKCGLSGVVASAAEASVLRKNFGNDFIIATPGIRLQAGTDADQKRVLTPEEAVRNGSDYLIVGRPVLQSTNRKETIAKIRKQLKEATSEF